MPDPGAGEPWFVVVRVAPPGDVVSPARGLRLCAGDVEERSLEADVALGERAAHAGDGPSAGPPGESEQHRLGLVVAGVAEEDEEAAAALGQLGQRGVPGR